MYPHKFKLEEQQDCIDYLNGISFTGFYKLKNNVRITSIDQKCTFDLLNANCHCLLKFDKRIILQ